MRLFRILCGYLVVMTGPGEPTICATRHGAACPAQTRRLDRTTRRRPSAAELAVSSGLTETRLKQSSPSAVARGHGGAPRLAKSRNHPAGSPPRQRPQTRRSFFLALRTPRLRDSRRRLLHAPARPSVQGSRDFAGEARWCVVRRPTRGSAVQGCANPGLTDRRPPLGDGGAAAGQPRHYSSVDEPVWSGTLARMGHK